MDGNILSSMKLYKEKAIKHKLDNVFLLWRQLSDKSCDQLSTKKHSHFSKKPPAHQLILKQITSTTKH